MSLAYDPYSPLDVLKPVADGIWVVDGPEIRMQVVPGFAFPFPTRMTIVRLSDGALWVHSPIEPADALFEALAGLGDVRFLVAPNTLHYWWLPDWQARYPDARTWALPELRRKARRPVRVDHQLGDRPPDEWLGAFDMVAVRSRIFSEADFFHRATRTLILTDLIENFEPQRVRSPLLRFIARLGGVLDPDGKMPRDMRFALGNHQALRMAIETMLSWAPERLILAHGRWYDSDGTAELRRAFRWALPQEDAE